MDQPRVRADSENQFLTIGDVLVSWKSETCKNHSNGHVKYPPLFLFPDKATHGVEFIAPPTVSVGVNTQSSGSPAVAFGIYSGNLSREQYNVGLVPTYGSGQPNVDMSIIAIGTATIADGEQL